ncbi:IPT/TIG domain-containing protein [Kitasatospora sp. NPDC101155]|uniref:IPT/TIG domain-containing protein n=1 Tax=Kitasatospora sp. NPDC101155 TaxID=3364097 RepID=UPI003820B04F
MVTFTGADLATTQEVTFDTTPAAFAVISDQTITATAPPHPAGGITITVTTLGGSTQSTYTYLGGPVI